MTEVKGGAPQEYEEIARTQNLKFHPIEKAFHRMRKSAEKTPESPVFDIDLDDLFGYAVTEFYTLRYSFFEQIT